MGRESSSSGTEYEVFIPAIRDELLPQIQRSTKQMPPKLQVLFEKIELNKKMFFGETPTDPDEIVARRALVKFLLGMLEMNINKLPEKVRVIAAIMLSTRKKLGETLDLLADEKIAQKNKPDPEKVTFFQSQIRKILMEMHYSEEPQSEKRTIRFSELSKETKFNLLFAPFVNMANEEFIIPEDAMDSVENRLAAAHALSKEMHQKLKPCKIFYNAVSAENRELTGWTDTLQFSKRAALR